MTDRTGQRLDNYHLLLLLGQGSFGDVYLAEHMHQHTRVALKVLTLHFDQDTLKNFLHEARTLFLLKHPSIVPLLDFGLEKETPFLVMEYAPNGTLRQRHRSRDRLPLDIVTSYVQQVASALQYAHDRRLIHRDVKPQNMLVGSNGQVLLSDFGVSAIAHSEHSQVTQKMMGTLSYMAPEQAQGKVYVATDQYALGICAYEWLCGVRPFIGATWEVIAQHSLALPPSLRSHVPEMSGAVEAVVLRALAKDPQERFPSVSEFATALRQASQTSASYPSVPTLSQLQESGFFRAPTMPSSQGSPSSSLIAHNPKEIQTDPSNAGAILLPPLLPREGSSPPVFVAHGQSPYGSTLRPPAQVSNPIASPMFRGNPSNLPLTPIPLSPNRRILSKRWLLALLGVALLVLGGTLASVWALSNQASTSLTKTPTGEETAQARQSLAAAQATAAAPAYKNWISKNGIMFGFDAAHTHWNKLEQAVSISNLVNLHPLWSYATNSDIESSLTVANGMVYASSDDGRLYVFDADCRENCQPLWSYATGKLLRSSPAVANGMVYVGSNDNKLYAFNANCHADCQPLWSYATSGGIDSSPVVSNGKVYVGSWDDNLYAFDAKCREACQPLWSYKTGDGVFSSPAIANGKVYVGSVDGALYVFDANCLSACQPLWSYPTGSDIRSSPAIANGTVYVGSSNGMLYAFNAQCRQACQPLWSYATGNAIHSSPAIASGIVYVGSDNGKLYAFDAQCRQACQPLWFYRTGSAILSSPTVANGVVYVGSADHNLYAFNAQCQSGCQPLWLYATGGITYSSPTVANGVIYIGSADHNVYAIGIGG
jgi:eukaryotic-like serine/threonine-protein kinase